MSEWIEDWRSARLSPDAQALARDVVHRVHRQSISEADRDLKTVERLMLYLAQGGLEVQAGTPLSRLFADDSIIGYEQHLHQRTRAGEITAGTARTHASRLIALARELGVDSPAVDKRGHTHRTARATTPMPDDAFATWLRVAKSQPSEIIGARFRAMLLLCRGAGLGSSDIRYVRGSSIFRRRDRTVAIRIDQGAARVAVVLGRYAADLHSLSLEFGDSLIVGEAGRRADPVSSLVDDVVGGAGLPRPMPRPLRDAYILEMLQTPGLETHRLWEQLGGKSLSAIEALIGLVPPGNFDDRALVAGCVTT